jgi:hypothetical protein
MTEKNKYADMLDMSHHVSKRHPQMSLLDRAAQFSPFAALNGYGDAILETGRITKEKPVLSEDAKVRLDEKLRTFFFDDLDESKKKSGEEDRKKCMQSNMETINLLEEKNCQEIKITYYEADLFKEGGEIKTISASPWKIDEYEKTLVLKDKTRIPIDDILDLQLQ